MQTGHDVRLGDAASAAVITQPQLAEMIEAPHWRFRFECRGPRPEDAERYLAMREQHERLLKRTDGLLRFARRDEFREAERIEQFLRDMEVDKWCAVAHNRVTTEGKNDLIDKYFRGSAYTAAFYLALIGAGTGTVAITSATASVTGTTTAFAAGDVSGDIIIVGAGAASADLITTVATYTSATAITTAANAGTTVSGANYAIGARVADTAASKSFNENTTYSNANRPTLTLAAASAGSTNNSASPAVFNINGTTRIFGAAVYTNNTKGGTTGVLYSGAMFQSPGSRAMANGDTLNCTATLSAT